MVSSPSFGTLLFSMKILHGFPSQSIPSSIYLADNENGVSFHAIWLSTPPGKTLPLNSSQLQSPENKIIFAIPVCPFTD